MARPGIMLYFDILGPIRLLPDSDKGRLLVAMLEYGQSGIVPEFDGALALAWEFVRPNLDRDEEAYENAKVQRNYATFCKQRKSLKLPKIPFEEWLNMTEDERKRMVTEDNEPKRTVDFGAPRYPTTTTTTTPSTNTTTSTTTAAAATATTTDDGGDGSSTDNVVKVLHGELGKGVVFLSDAQISDLLDRMDIDTFDHYVDKLSSFIIKNDAKVKNHYETILKWWNEDGAVGRQPKAVKAPKGDSGKLGQAELNNIQRLLSED